MEFYIYTLRTVAEHLQLPSMKAMLRDPCIRAAYRVSVHYGDRRARDSVATLFWRSEPQSDAPGSTPSNDATLQIGFQGAFDHKLLTSRIPVARYAALRDGMQRLRFDHMADQDSIPFHGVDVWLVERGAGTFTKSVLLAPASAQGNHAKLVDLVRQHLPEALREVQ